MDLGVPRKEGGDAKEGGGTLKYDTQSCMFQFQISSSFARKAQGARSMLQVVLPPAAYPGQTLATISPTTGERLSFCVPFGCYGGSTLTLDQRPPPYRTLPPPVPPLVASTQLANAGPRQVAASAFVHVPEQHFVQVAAPAGAVPGTILQVADPHDGSPISFQVPTGTSSGDVISVPLPSPEERAANALAARRQRLFGSTYCTDADLGWW